MRQLLLTLMILPLLACQSAYYAAWEKVGVEKRDILRDRVVSARDSQEQAQQQFSSALAEFSALLNFDGGELQQVYDELKDQFEASQASAERVTGRIDKVEDVAQALFDEWQTELEKYSSEKLRRDSERKLRDTQRRYNSMLKAMRKAESTMMPVLTALQDNVLYLKHNLNASAIGSLQGEFGNIKQDIGQLLKEMNTAIEKSDAFIASIQS